MPETEVVYYKDEDRTVPVMDWLRQMRRRDKRIPAKCRDKITQLKTFGHELRRPDADLLRDGIYELRIRYGSVNYRLLYFYHGRQPSSRMD